jgi:acyl transferase domain-containing protein
MRMMAEQGYDLFLELGPTSTLLNQGKRCLPENTATWLPSLQKEPDNWEVLLQTVGTLYVKGLDADWRGFDGDYTRRRVSLPTYPFERERYWIEAERAEGVPAPQQISPQPAGAKDRHPFLDLHTELAYPAGMHAWETLLDKQRLPYLNDHRIQGIIALPISVYIEMIQAAAVEAFGQGPHVLKDIELKKILLLPEQGAQKVQVILSQDAQKHASFRIYSHSTGVPEQQRDSWTLHASGEIVHT